MDENIVVNVDFEGDENRNDAVFNNSIQVVPANIAWEDFELMLKVYADQEDIHVYYTDSEGILVKLLTQEELDGAFSLAKTCNNTLHLRVQCGIPLELKQQSPDSEYVTSDLRNQTVIMRTRHKIASLQADAVPIAMETGEHMMQNGPGCDWVVTKETGEKQCVTKPVKSAEGSEARVKSGSNGRKFFFLKHKESGFVLEVKISKQTSGTNVMLCPKKDRQVTNQLWYIHEPTKTLRCKGLDRCFDASDKCAAVLPYVDGKTSQMWQLDGTRISHRFNSDWVIGPQEEGEIQEGSGIVACCDKRTERLAWVVEYRNPDGMDLSKSARLLKATHARQNRGLGDVLEIDKELDQLGQHVQKLEIKVPPTAREIRKTQSPADKQTQQPKKRDPPDWFQSYMKDLKKDMVEQVSAEVANKTVSQVLRGLQGAVIASVSGSGQTMDAPSNGEAIPQANLYHHYGIVCDRCEKTIVGVRYKCGNCEDYDLCSDCEALPGTSSHPYDHVFLKIRRPVMSAGRSRDGKLTPLLRYNLYRHEERIVRDLENEGFVFPKKEEKRQPRPQGKDHMEKMKKKQEKLRKKVDKSEEKLKKKEKRRLEEEKLLPEKKEKLERPDICIPDHMDAEFLYDTTIPDGTHMQPLTTFVKTWRLKNTGTIPWTNGTSLMNSWGNMTPVQEEIKVQNTGVGEEISISAEIVAPEQPGTYQSHWRLSYCGLYFGHRVWCSIVVDPKEILEETLPETRKEKTPDLEVVKHVTEEEKDDQQIQCYDKADSTIDLERGEARSDESDVKVKESKCEQEIVVRVTESDKPEIREVCTARASQTVTPNNTPQDSRAASPPQSPVCEMLKQGQKIWTLSNSSSVEVVSDDNNSVTQEMTFTSDLVAQRMAELELKPDIDLQSVSSCDFSSDSEEDFYVVPIPDCFIPNLPPSKEASTSVYIKKEDSQQNVMTKPLSESQQLESQPLLSASHNFEYELLDTENREILIGPEPEEIELLTLEKVSDESANQSNRDIEALAEQESVEVKPELVNMEEMAKPEPKIHQIPETSRSICSEVKEDAEVTETEVKQRSPEVVGVLAMTEETEVKERSYSEDNNQENSCENQATLKQDQSNSGETEAVASKLVATAIDVATKATGSVYKTAKDVFQTLKHGREYVPRSSEWTPPHPDKEWTPPKQQWTPPEQRWPLPEANENPGPAIDDFAVICSPMQTLIEMGFADRQLNKELLQKHENDLEKVIQELLSRSHNDWHSSRH